MRYGPRLMLGGGAGFERVPVSDQVIFAWRETRAEPQSERSERAKTLAPDQKKPVEGLEVALKKPRGGESDIAFQGGGALGMLGIFMCASEAHFGSAPAVDLLLSASVV